jgi:lipopolysaccharide export system permease protein
MKILDRMLLKSFIINLIGSLLFFVLILELLDLFANLWRYLNNDVPLNQILRVSFLYLPKCVSFALPISVLFSSSYTLGNFYANNELISIFGAGVSLYRFIAPVLIVSLFLSFFLYSFEENVVIDTYRKKGELSTELLKRKKSMSNSNVTVSNPDRKIIYNTDYYNDSNKTLSSLVIIDRTNGNRFPERIDSKWAKWDDTAGYWILMECRVFSWNSQFEKYDVKIVKQIEKNIYNLKPDTFRKIIKNIDELKKDDAREWIQSLRSAGLPFRKQLTEYYKRFSFPLTCLIVAMIASSIGGRFKKNILLMSLLISLLIATGYYILQMVLILFAKLGYIPPAAGAWGTFLVFLLASAVLFKFAKS